jgi:triosephosphate isomerase
MRKPIVAGNWKMNKVSGDAAALALAVVKVLGRCESPEVVLCPPFTSLKAVADVVRGTAVKLGAQNVHWEKEGAFTGEISPAMLVDSGCSHVIVGHSERRTYFRETDEMVNRKAHAALAAGLCAIVCVGETLHERESARTAEVVTTQVRESLAGFGKDLLKIVVAYEPVWAIGTGRTATPAQAQEVHGLIRDVMAAMEGREIAQGVRIQYGGSVKASNARELFTQHDIDGGLIGGASLEAASFVEIVKAAS